MSSGLLLSYFEYTPPALARSTVPPPQDPGLGHRVLGALAHPLPAGMRDWLPPDARQQAELARGVLQCFELFGYELVTLPVFEYADVLERGLGALEADSVLRFVEPETGAVVALRPDMTPQIARLLATRLAELPTPARLCYHGSVLRRPRERARRNRQIPQAGIELLGLEGPAGDLEVLKIAVAALRSAGLQEFVIDLGHARIVGALLENLSAERAKPLVEALQAKDDTLVAKLASESGLPKADAKALAALPELHGGQDVWAAADKQLANTSAAPAVRELRVLWNALAQAGLVPKLLVDFSETRNFEYYTGVMFHMHAAGPGAPIGSGGRYDGLLDRFGLARPAAGFAVTLDNLAWARRQAGCVEVEAPRLLIVGNSAGLADALRAHGVACAEAPERDSLAYARAWRYTHVLEVLPGQSVLTRLRDNQQQTIVPDPLVIERAMGAE